ncbi:MAG: Fe-S cluster assembly protein SufD [Methylococcaceae bacterium]|nr:Fe-S cluster assembly protein SufD [Methylococcaceae bacterium]MDP2394269.1 Fe-S cluster assembly protein SufD [Methylococcaceae bacterium]MDP3020097.1 Fe-S cluster assembly protein SufD [Methylococcaceae bacterium]MDP3388839.1 Fe-S cluster assembly protein SufD [Methylococcaceae bacterium]MDP3934553.1 Fe-S cluster assembly protein SufD [Methylococcaceae bacterium]
MSAVTASHYTADYPAIAPSLPGQSLPWLQQLRTDALQAFSATGFPSPREEEWRYTNVSGIEKKLFSVPANQAASDVSADLLKAYQLQDAWSVVLVNGRFSAELSALSGLPDGVSILSLADALATQASQVQSHLGQAVNNAEHGFVAFNTAWFSDGLFVHVPPKQVLAKPIQLLHIVTQADALATTRNVIIVEESAEVKVVETFVGADNAYLTAAVTEVFVGQNADLTLYKIQSESEKAYHFGGIYIKQERDARFTHHNFAFGGLMARSDIHADLDHSSECVLNGLYLGVKRQHIDNHTRINHLKPYGISRETYKGVLDDKARGVFQGRVVVAEDAQKTDSQMNNRNLLLSVDAEVDTKPQLEIYADDVKCGHGVTVGQLDDKSVFYLQSRCIDEETARNMLTFAFANEMVDKISIKSLHDNVLEQVLARFPQQGVDKEWL